MNRLSLRVCLILFVLTCLFARAVTADPLVQGISFNDGPAVFRPPVLFLPLAQHPPTIDGRLDDDLWRHAVTADHLKQQFFPADRRTPSPATTVKIARDQQAIYIAFICDEPNLAGIIDKSGGKRDAWAQDVVEVFFDVQRDGPTVWHFATNSVGWQYDAKTAKFLRHDAGKEFLEHDPKWQSAAHIGDKQWTVEIAIPFAEIGIDAAAHEGRAIAFNLARERMNRDGKHELTVWSPTSGIFCKSERYGYIFLGDQAAWDKVKSQYVPTAPIEIVPYMDRRTYRNDIAIAGGGVNVGDEDLAGLELHLAIKAGDKTLRQQVLTELENNRLYFNIDLSNLAPGEYQFAIDAVREGVVGGTGVHDFRVIAAPTSIKQGRIALTQSQSVARGVDRWHVRTGVPMPDGAMFDVAHVGVFDNRGNQVPAQIQPTAHWSKQGAIKWLSVDFTTPLKQRERKSYQLRFGPGITPVEAGRLITNETPASITVDTGVAKFVIRKSGFNLIDQMWVGDDQRLTSGESRGLYTVGDDGDVFWASLDPDSTVIIEEVGPQATVLKASGAHKNAAGQALCRYVMHLYFYADTPYIRLQHTFIISEDSTQTRYADIGMTMPLPGDRAVFGLPANRTAGRLETAATHSVSLLQRSANSFVIKDNAEGQVILESDRAPGWIARGDVALIVRDFWQNYPKELQATPEGLRVHFWPAHGETVLTPEQEVEPDNAWRLPFAHQGKRLDFNIPDYYFGNEALEAARFDRNNSARACNAMGVGKTHDMLLSFGDVEQVAAINDAFQQDVHFMPDVTWVCQTEVAGGLHPYDRDRFAELEDYFSRGHDFLMRAMFDANEAYGMFNYGDGFTMLQTASAELKQSYYRLWAGYHHGRARVPWLLYLRSGDPKYLSWARANTAHIGDVDTCHYTTPAFSEASGLARKLVGGLCTYNAVVHWEHGSLFNYNSMADIFLYDYYLTGNRRAWDVVQEVVAIAKLEGDKRCPPNRAGAGILATALQCYEATWDPQLMVTFLANIPNMYTKPAQTHQPRSVTWAPYLEPYIRFSDDPKAKEFLLDHAAYLAELDTTGTRIQYHHRELAEASRLTGDPKYRMAAWSHLTRLPGLFNDEQSNFDGEVYWLDYSFLTQHALYLLKSVAEMDTLPTLAELPSIPGSGGPTTWVHGLRTAGEKQSLTVTVEDHDDKPFQFGTRFGTYGDVDYTLFDPNNKPIAQGVIHPPDHDQYVFQLAQPSDGVRGTYRMELTSPRRFTFWYASVSDLGTHRFHLPPTDAPRGPLKELPGLGCYGKGRWYFFVPADCEQFRISVAGWPDQRTRTVVGAVTPDNRMVGRISLLPRDQGDLVIEPKRAHRGKIWALSFDSAIIVDVEGIDRWFAGTVAGAQPIQ